jgi:UrcA family protein
MIRMRLVLASVLIATASVAQADSTSVALSSDGRLRQTVEYSDLNLTNSLGAQKLYGRLNAAAKVVCAPLATRGLKSHVKHRSCVNEALTAAVVEVNQPLLTKIHQRDNTTEGTRIALRN